MKPRREDLLQIAELVDRKPDTIKRIILRQGNYKDASGPLIDLVMLAWKKIMANRIALQQELQALKQQHP